MLKLLKEKFILIKSLLEEKYELKMDKSALDVKFPLNVNFSYLLAFIDVTIFERYFFKKRIL